MGNVAKTPKLGPRWWIENNLQDRINASWGSREAWEKIPDWKDMDLSRPSDRDPGVKIIPVSENPDEMVAYKCEECGCEVIMKRRTKAAGHGCPKCMKARVRLK